MNKTELIQQIRFAIDQLKSTNRTMDFEHICRFFARARIVQNVIPATGPVQSFGDQGRDFETFHSYLSKSTINHSCSVGFANKPIAFPCSLEKNPLKKNGKIDSDIKTILGSGTKVERIYFFSGEDIPVGSRHKKQSEVKIKFEVELDIIDAQAISEHLSDPDLFWIATQYLNIPSDFFPKKEEENWYSNLFNEYTNRTITLTFEEFDDVKSAIRHIYKDPELKVDLPFWLNKMSLFLTDSESRDLKRKAIYETFVAKLIGQNDISTLEEIIRDYFSDVDKYINPAAIEDAQVLLTFVENSKKILGPLISDEEIHNLKNLIKEIIERELKGSLSSSKRCSYMEIQANFLINEYIKDENKTLLNVPAYVKKIHEIIPKLDSSPFFPLERLTKRVFDYLGIVLEFGGETKQLDNLIKSLEPHLGKRNSELTIGDSIRNRAVAYMKAGKITISISLLHELKVKWFKNEATRGVILTSMLLGECYSKLQMEFASKYYYLIATDMSLAYHEENDVLDLFPKAIKKASESAYSSGSWLHYLDLSHTVIGSSFAIIKDFNIYESEEMASLIYYPGLIKHFANKFDMSVLELINKKLENWEDLNPDIENVLNLLEKAENLSTNESIIKVLNSQLVGIPFNDIGKIRIIKFNIFGSDWVITFENNYFSNAVGEQFVTMLQIYLVELANEELFLTKSSVTINLKIEENLKTKIKKIPSNTEHIWDVEIPYYIGEDREVMINYQSNSFGIIASILRGLSLLPDSEMKKILETKFSEGLTNAFTFGSTYQELYFTYFNKEDFDSNDRTIYDNLNILKHFKLKSNSILPLNESLSPTYDYDKNIQHIKNRINHLHPFEITLSKMRNEPKFMEIINELREDWLDWQIFLAFGNLMIQYKIMKFTNIVLNENSSELIAKEYAKYYDKPEHEWHHDIPIEVFSAEKMKKYLTNINILTILNSYKLEAHYETPDFEAIKELLIKRFNFLEDGKDIIVF